MKHLQHMSRMAVCALVLWTAGFVVHAQTADLASLESEFQTLQTKLDSLQWERVRLSGEADIVARRIAVLRDRDPLSNSDHRQLEKALRESQRLTNQVSSLDHQILQISDERNAIAQRLIVFAQVEITRLLAAADLDTTSKRQDLLVSVDALLDQKQQWESIGSDSRVRVGNGLVIEARQEDTPRQLQLKSDLLSDRIETIRQEIRQAAQRVKALREEHKIRQQMTELAEDLDLFNEDEEILDRQRNTETKSQPGGTYRNADNRTPEMLWLNPSQSAWTPDAVERSQIRQSVLPRQPEEAATLEETIARWDAYLARMQSLADSLDVRAGWFRSQAESRKQ